MNPVRPDQLGRWSDGGSTGPAESAAQELFSQGARGTPPPPSPAHLDKLWTGAAKAAAAGAGGAAVLSVGTKVLFAALATGGAATAWVALQGDGVNTPPVVSPAPPRAAPEPPVPVPAPPVPVPAPVVVPTAPAVPAVPEKPRVVKTPPATGPAKADADQPKLTPPPTPAALPTPPLVPLPTAEADDDSVLVVRALGELTRGEAEVALRTLQERQDRFGTTKHSGPAGLVKTEALRQAGRVDEALKELDRLEREGQFPPGRARELPLIRAELLVAAKRCTDAVPLFEQMVDDRAFSTRARAGLAACGEPLP